MNQTTTHSHILSAYDDELKFLTRRIAEMGGLAEQMCADAVRALVNSDAALAQKVISDDAILDHSEREIGAKAMGRASNAVATSARILPSVLSQWPERACRANSPAA